MDSQYQLYIGGKWVDSKNRFEVRNPANGQVLASVPDADVSQMAQAIESAVQVERYWAQRPAQERSRILMDASRLMRERKEELAKILTSEEGKPLTEARGEILYAASFLDWFAEEGKRIYGDTIPANSPDKRILVFKQPVGVCLAITPWNFPSAMITRKLGPALAAGCPVIVKPSELTPLSALEIAKIFEEAGLPQGVLSIIVGRDAAGLTEVAMEDPRVRKISFTGSTEVGKHLMQQAASTVKRVSLELGGHAPFIVFPDADLDQAVKQAVVAKMRGMGETCVAANRFYVHEKIMESFAEKMASHFRSMKVGNGLEAEVQVGPLVNKETLEKVERHVEDAVNNGAIVVTGGRRAEIPGGFFYEPTVLTHTDDSMILSREETFGPVAPLFSFCSEREVIEKANQTPSGLAAYFFTRDVGRVFRLSEQLDYGILGANDGLPSTAQAPFGGMKESGLGREGSKYGLEEYLEIKYISLGGIQGKSD